MKKINNKKKDGEYLVIFDDSALATLAIDLEDKKKNYLGSLCCSLYGVQVSFVA